MSDQIPNSITVLYQEFQDNFDTLQQICIEHGAMPNNPLVHLNIFSDGSCNIGFQDKDKEYDILSRSVAIDFADGVMAIRHLVSYHKEQYK